MKLLIGTRNPAKKQEIKEGLSSLKGIELVFPEDLNIEQDPEETGKSFEENAFLKAKFYAEASGLPVVSDDGGLEIPILGGEPGVYSRRWLGREVSDEELIEYTLRRLAPFKGNKRRAFLTCVVCFYDPENKVKKLIRESIKGRIALKPSEKRIQGYPYRSLFIVEELDKYYDELSEEEHRRINHRLRALDKLKDFLAKQYLLD